MTISEDGSLMVWMPDGGELELSCVTLEGEEIEHQHDMTHMQKALSNYVASQAEISTSKTLV